MSIYPYRCSKGHETCLLRSMREKRPKRIACEICGRPAHSVVSVPNVIGDIPEHFNETLGEAVRGRQHLQSIQRERGVQDFEPSAKLKEQLKFSREKLLHNAGRGRCTVGVATHGR